MSKTIKSIFINSIMLQLFAEPYGISPNVTTQDSMSPTMKTFYDTALLENARAVLIFNQFGDKQKMKGDKIEWRKFDTFDKALTPLTEGVTPDGSKFGMTKIEASTTQHGDYTPVSDRLELESYDDVIYGATEEMGLLRSSPTFTTLPSASKPLCTGKSSVMQCCPWRKPPSVFRCPRRKSRTLPGVS